MQDVKDTTDTRGSTTPADGQKKQEAGPRKPPPPNPGPSRQQAMP